MCGCQELVRPVAADMCREVRPSGGDADHGHTRVNEADGVLQGEAQPL